jgi:hypothetical protein
MSAVEAASPVIRSTIPARLDRLRWSPFHTRTRRECGIPHSQRDLADRDPGGGDCRLLRHRQIADAFGPAIFGARIGDGMSRTSPFVGCLVGGGTMILGGGIEIPFGVNADGKSLETVTRPLTSVAEKVTAVPTKAPA